MRRTLEERLEDLERRHDARLDAVEGFMLQMRGALRLSAALLGVLGGLIVAVVIRALSGS